MEYDDYIKAKALLLTDPNSGYTQEDFNKEFGETDISTATEFRKLTLNFTNKSNNQDPDYATDGASGFDLRADLETPVKIGVGKRMIIPTGLYFDIPDNLEIQIRPRSGLAAKNGVTVLNTPGTIDSDYLGEIKIILINLGEEDFIIQHGDRIAQAVVCPVAAKNVIHLNKISEITTQTERGSNGFGSTGKN